MITAARNPFRRGKIVMANSLYFMLENESTLVRAREFFLSRKNYMAQEDIFVYENEDTEFAFTLELHAENADIAELPEIKGPHVLINVNYLRSETYIEEVSKELEAFAASFSFIFYDEATGEISSFSINKFKADWKKANKSGLKGMTDEYGIKIAQDELLLNAWTWNYHRRSNELSLKDEYYFAKVMFESDQKSSNSVKTICTWPDLILVAFPSFVQEIIVIREIQKKEGFFSRALGRKPNIDTFGKRVNLEDLKMTGAFETVSKNRINYLLLKDANCGPLQDLFQSATTPIEMIHKGIELISPERIVEKSISS
jgi:hypothetical protein